jgi:hypothetical protein
VLVFTRGGVGTPATAEFDFALVEVEFEVSPFLCGDRRVLAGGAPGATWRQVELVVADNILVEDGDEPWVVCRSRCPSRAAPMWMGSPRLTRSVAKSRRKSCGVNRHAASSGMLRGERVAQPGEFVS